MSKSLNSLYEIKYLLASLIQEGKEELKTHEKIIGHDLQVINELKEIKSRIDLILDTYHIRNGTLVAKL